MTPQERDHARAINDFEAQFGSPGDWVGCWSTWRAHEERYLAHHASGTPVDLADPSSIGEDGSRLLELPTTSDGWRRELAVRLETLACLVETDLAHVDEPARASLARAVASARAVLAEHDAARRDGFPSTQRGAA